MILIRFYLCHHLLCFIIVNKATHFFKTLFSILKRRFASQSQQIFHCGKALSHYKTFKFKLIKLHFK